MIMLFSILTPCKNDLSGLKDTYDSLLAQNCRDFEWIVVDCRSADGTVEWLEKTGLSSLRWISEPDRHLFDGQNKALAMARGDYVLFLNAGDRLACRTTLSKVSGQIAGQTLRPLFLYGDSIDYDNKRKHLYFRAASHRRLRSKIFACTQAMFFAREAVGALRHDLSYPISADYKFLYEFFVQNRLTDDRLVRLNFPICYWKLGGNCRPSWALFRDDLRVRKEIIGRSRSFCYAYLAYDILNFFLQKMAPWLKDYLRYGIHRKRLRAFLESTGPGPVGRH